MLNRILYFINLIFECIVYLLRFLDRGYSDSVANLNGQTAIVTGGNGGIGFHISALLASRGCKVIIACRSKAIEERDELIKMTGNPNIEVRNMDLSSLESVRNFAKNIKDTEKKIDILINNAGVGSMKQKITNDGLNATMQINYFGHFLLTHLLFEPLKASGKGRVIFTSSGLGIFHNLTVDNINITDYKIQKFTLLSLYSNSKQCNTLAGQEFAKKFKKHGIKAYTADTGCVKTKIYEKAMDVYKDDLLSIIVTKFVYFVSRDGFRGAQTTFHLATSNEGLTNGDFYFRCKKCLKSLSLKDEKYCDEIWRKTEELVKLKPEEKIK